MSICLECAQADDAKKCCITSHVAFVFFPLFLVVLARRGENKWSKCMITSLSLSLAHYTSPAAAVTQPEVSKINGKLSAMDLGQKNMVTDNVHQAICDVVGEMEVRMGRRMMLLTISSMLNSCLLSQS